MSLQVSRSGVVQEFPLRGTAAILDRARSMGSLQAAPPKLPQVVTELIASFLPLNGRKEITKKLCHVFRMGSTLPSVLARINKTDSLDAQQNELERIINDYSKDPKNYPLPSPPHRRSYLAPVSITLNDNQVNVEILNFLKEVCPNIRALNLQFFKSSTSHRFSQVSDEILKIVATFSSLKRLAIRYGNQCTHEGLLSLCSLNQLESFAISHSQDYKESISPEAAKQLLSALSSLKELDLSELDDDEATSTFMNALDQCPDLECLLIRCFHQENIALLERLGPHLTKLKKCVIIDMVELVVEEEAMRALKSLKSLESLITNYSFSVEALRELVGLKDLHTLRIGALSGEGLALLASFPKLSNLRFTCFGAGFSSEALRELAERLPQLRELFIRDIPPEAMDAISSFTQLEALSLFISLGSGPNNYHIPSECFVSLKNLKKLCLVASPTYGCNGIAGLDGVSINLRELTITIPYFNERLIEALTRFQELEKVSIVFTAYTQMRLQEGIETKAVDVNDAIEWLVPSWPKLTDFQVIGGIIGNDPMLQIFYESARSSNILRQQTKMKVAKQGLDALLHLPHLKRIHCNWLDFTTDALRTFVTQHPRLREIAMPHLEATTRSWDKICLQNAAGEHVKMSHSI